MPFTPEQQAAIDARNPLLLVSAAAGSGKTAVLVQRVLSLIRQDGVSVSRMLIVTFTRAAAAEMRDRLQHQLSELGESDTRLRREAALVETAQISTIHAFCHALVQEFFPLVDVDPEAQLMQPAQRQELLIRALDDTVTESYEHPSEDMRRLQENFSDAQIVDMVASLYDFLLARPDPFAWLHGFAQKQYTAADLTQGALGAELLQSARLRLEGAQGFLGEALRLLCDPYLHDKYKEDIRADEQYLTALLAAATDGEALLSAARAGGFKTLSRVKLAETEELNSKARFTALRDEYKALVKEAVSLFPADPAKAARDLESMQPCLRALETLCLSLHERFQQDKREKGLLDFGDVEHMALSILRDAVTGPQIAARYDALFVDESQDVSGLQEALLSALYGRVRTSFLVGDVKQSIYRFRLAEPSLFLSKLETYGDEETAEKRRILLNRNFRSRENVLASVNYVFRRVMRRESTEIEYDDGAALWPGLPSRGDPTTELHALPAAPAARQAEREARLAASRILSLVGTEKRTREGEPDGAYHYRDFAILLPKAKGVSDVVERVLSESGIPTQVEGGAGTLDTPEITQTLSCLHLLDNAMDDLSLLSALRGPMFELTDAELCDIRLCAPEKGVTFYDALGRCASGDTALSARARGVLERLGQERFLLRSGSLSMYLWDFLHRSGLYAFYGAQSGGRERQRNLRLLCAMADDAEKSRQCDLHQFLKEAETAFLGGDGRAPSVVSPWEDVVRVMTIHKSKGLEFPVVFVLGLGQSLTLRDRPTALRTHAQLGVALKYVSRRAGTTRETALTRAIRDERVSEEVSERARLLYVAMTRAKDKLVLVGHLTRKQQWADWRLPNTPYRVRVGKSMLDWLGQTVCDAHGGVFTDENAESEVLHSELWESDLSDDLCTVSTGFPQKTPLWEVFFHSEWQKTESSSRKAKAAVSWQEGLMKRAEALRRARAKGLAAGGDGMQARLGALDAGQAEQRLQDAVCGARPEAVAARSIDEQGAVCGMRPDMTSRRLTIAASSERPQATTQVILPGGDAGHAADREDNMLGAYPLSGEYGRISEDPAEGAKWGEPTAAPAAEDAKSGEAAEAESERSGEVPKADDVRRDETPAEDARSDEAAPALADDRLRPLVTPPLSPLKLGVTALCRELEHLDPDTRERYIEEETQQDGETERDKRRPAPPVRTRLLDDEPTQPLYRQQEASAISGAQRGEATHKALSLLPLEAWQACAPETATAPVSADEVRRALDVLTTQGRLSSGERALCHAEQLAGFLNSPLGRRMRQSGDVRREWSFNARFPALSEAVVQGVIDLCFTEDGAWVLVDYKTDRVTDAGELLPRYGRQLALYREALRRITGREVKETWLYSLRLGAAVAVPEGDVSRETIAGGRA